MATSIIDRLQRFANDNPNTVIDPGNIEIKYATDTQPRNGAGAWLPKEGHFTHYFYELSQREWMQNFEQSATQADNEFAFVEIDDHYFVIGKRLQRVGADNHRVGNQKYSEEYILPIVASTLLRMYHGQLPKEINMAIGHPPMDKRNSDRIADMIKGRLKFSTPKDNYSIKIKETHAFTEIIGGVNRVALSLDETGRKLAGHVIKAGAGKTLAIDLGGGTFDVVDLDRHGSPTGLARTAMIGINNAIEEFKNLVAVEFEDILRQARVKGKISQETVVDCFRSPERLLRIGNKYYDASDVFLDSVGELMFSLNSAIDTMLGDDGYAGYHYVLIGGGGGDVLFDYLCSELFDFFAYVDQNGQRDWSKSVFRTGQPDKMIMANAEGALRTIEVIIAMSKKRV